MFLWLVHFSTLNFFKKEKKIPENMLPNPWKMYAMKKAGKITEQVENGSSKVIFETDLKNVPWKYFFKNRF